MYVYIYIHTYVNRCAEVRHVSDAGEPPGASPAALLWHHPGGGPREGARPPPPPRTTRETAGPSSPACCGRPGLLEPSRALPQRGRRWLRLWASAETQRADSRRRRRAERAEMRRFAEASADGWCPPARNSKGCRAAAERPEASKRARAFCLAACEAPSSSGSCSRTGPGGAGGCHTCGLKPAVRATNDTTCVREIPRREPSRLRSPRRPGT